MRFRRKQRFGIVFLSLTTFVLFYYGQEDPGNIHEDNGNLPNHRTTSAQPYAENRLKAAYTMLSQKKINTECRGLSFPGHLIKDQSWMPVDNKRDIFVYSAYSVEHGDVVIIGAKTHTSHMVYCQYWRIVNYIDGYVDNFAQRLSSVRTLPEGHRNKYSGVMLKCPKVSFIPTHVSLVSAHCGEPLNILEIKNGEKPENYERKFTICLRPLHFQYGRAYELVEWIELNRILGAEKIIVYNYSTAINVDRVLDYYNQKSITEVIQWHIPMTSYTFPRAKPVEIHSMATLPMLQDCFYRSRPYSEFVINIDVDEFIIPHSNNAKTWKEMFSLLNKTIDTYNFRNTFFRKEWNETFMQFSNWKMAKKLGMISLQIFEHEEKIWHVSERSKYITRTAKPKTLQIHQVKEVGSSFTVPIEDGFLHHYRNWEKYNDRSRRVNDGTVATKYGDRLLANVEEVWNDLKGVKMEIPFI